MQVVLLIKTIERNQCTNFILAQMYATTIRNGHDIPVDAGGQIEMKLPDFADHERIKKFVE